MRTHEEFQKRFREILRDRNLTPEQAAALIDVDKLEVEGWLAVGGVEPSRFERVGIIAELLGADLRAHRADHREIDWEHVDWTIPTTVLAAILNVDKTRVSKARRKFAPETIQMANDFRSNRLTDWGSVDWSKSNAELSRMYKCQRNIVSRQRLIHAPETRLPKGARNCVANWKKVDWKKPNAELASEMGVNITTVRRQRRKNSTDK